MLNYVYNFPVGIMDPHFLHKFMYVWYDLQLTAWWSSACCPGYDDVLYSLTNGKGMLYSLQ